MLSLSRLSRQIAVPALWACTMTILPAPATAQSTGRVSVDSAGVQGDGNSSSPAISGDGRYAAFYSDATNLVPGDTNGAGDAFVRDRRTALTTRVSVDSAGVEGDGASIPTSISDDGRFVAFMSLASNLVPGDTNGVWDCFVHDRQTGATTRVTVDSSGTEADGDSFNPSLSGDGRLVAFESAATNLVSGDTNADTDVFVHDCQTGVTTRVSVHSAGDQADRFSLFPSFSGDGGSVAFWSVATNLVPGDVNGKADVFVHDLPTATTQRVSVASSGAEGDRGSYAPSLSRDGRHVAFHSFATNLVAGDTNSSGDIFVHDRQTGTTTRVSVDTSGSQGNDSSLSASLSGDARHVAFHSRATNLVPGDTNGSDDSFLHDRQTGATTRVSIDSSRAEGNGGSYTSRLSRDGRFVAFFSDATNLAPGDTNGLQDVFVHGPDLTLEASPEVVSAGATLTLTTWTGQASGLAMLVITDINGTPMFVKVTKGNFDGTGQWLLSGVAPPSLAGNVITFLGFGTAPTGRVGLTNPEKVTFQ